MVGKLNAAGTAYVYQTFLSGAGPYRYGSAIAIDSSGDAYVAGCANAAGIATTANAFRTTPSQMFVSELDPTGANLLYSTYIPGANDNLSQAIGMPSGVAVDTTGDIFLTGSAGAGFVTTANAYQPALGAGATYNAFLAELNPSLPGTAQLLYGSYLGGGAGGFATEGTGIALDGLGNAYITGVTASASFPTTPGAFQTSYGGGGYDSFVAKFNTSLSGAASLVYSTFLGGGGWDGIVPGHSFIRVIHEINPGPGIAVDSSGDAYVAGVTTSGNFPTTSGAFQTKFQGSVDAYVTKLNPAGSGLVYSTLLGGKSSNGSGAMGIAVDANGNATATGWTWCTDFPTLNSFESKQGGLGQTFVTTLNPPGSGLLFSTYLGGSNTNFGSGVAVDPAGNVYVASANYSARTGVVYEISGSGSGPAGAGHRVPVSGMSDGVNFVSAPDQGGRSAGVGTALDLVPFVREVSIVSLPATELPAEPASTHLVELVDQAIAPAPNRTSSLAQPVAVVVRRIGLGARHG